LSWNAPGELGWRAPSERPEKTLSPLRAPRAVGRVHSVVCLRLSTARGSSSAWRPAGNAGQSSPRRSGAARAVRDTCADWLWLGVLALSAAGPSLERRDGGSSRPLGSAAALPAVAARVAARLSAVGLVGAAWPAARLQLFVLVRTALGRLRRAARILDRRRVRARGCVREQCLRRVPRRP